MRAKDDKKGVRGKGREMAKKRGNHQREKEVEEEEEKEEEGVATRSENTEITD